MDDTSTSHSNANIIKTNEHQESVHPYNNENNEHIPPDITEDEDQHLHNDFFSHNTLPKREKPRKS